MFDKIKTNLKVIKENHRQLKINSIEKRLFKEYYDIYNIQRNIFFESHGIHNLDGSQKENLNNITKELYCNRISKEMPRIMEDEFFANLSRACLKFTFFGLAATGELGVAMGLGISNDISLPIALGICSLGLAFVSVGMLESGNEMNSGIIPTYSSAKSYAIDTDVFYKLAEKKYEKEYALKQRLSEDEKGLEL